MKRILFRCCTFYQLINAINIKINLLADSDADLIVNLSTDFTQVIERLKKTKIFKQIATMQDSLEDNRDFKKLSSQDKLMWFEDLEKNMIDFPFKDIMYTDYYIAINDEYNTFIYYYLVKKGLSPNVHIFEESKATYILNILEVEKKDGIPHSQFGIKNMYRHIDEVLLYEPQFYDVDYHRCRFTQIPKLNCQLEEIQSLYRQLFGEYKFPEERYIFLVSPFFWDKFSADEIDVIDDFAKIVGKENLILKMHPRDQINRYSSRGYKVIEDMNTPLEAIMISEDMSQHVLVSISSNASITADLMLDKMVFSIMLEAFLKIGRGHSKLKEFMKLDKRMTETFNKKERHLFSPATDMQLLETIRYIERKLSNNDAN